MARSKQQPRKEPSTGSQLLLQALSDYHVQYLFGIPGGANLPLYDAVGQSGPKHISALHEQGAGHMATGYAKASGRVGVALATSGPGATNLVTAIADAYMDSAPVLFITGQVRSELLGTDAFQEADIFGITMPIVKHSFALRQAAQIPETISAAIQLASSGRPGPVLVDIPQDVLAEQISGPVPRVEENLAGYRPPRDPNQRSLRQIAAAINQAQRPVFYGGGGIIASQSSQLFRELVEKTGIPVTTTLMALGAYPADPQDPLWLGMLGMHGSRAANWAVDQCDLLLAWGARFDDRVTGRLSQFAPQAKIVHLDVDPAEINKLVTADIALCADLRLATEQLLALLGERQQRPDWRQQIASWKEDHPFSYQRQPGVIKPQQLVEALAEQTAGEANISSDVGQHQMWVAQYYPFSRPRQWINSGGSGTMGVGLPYALGAALADPEHQSVLVTGDGSLPMTVQELHVASRYQLAVKIFVINNGGYGMVRQWQDLFWEQGPTAVELGPWPDWPAVAQSWGVPGQRVSDPQQLDAAVAQTLADPGPALLEVVCDPAENCYPMIPAGAAARDMVG